MAVNIENYQPVLDENGEATGMLRNVGNRTGREVVADLIAAMGPLAEEVEYASLGMAFAYMGLTAVPPYRRVAVYAVAGGSEGHYVHVDLHVQSHTEANTLNVVNLMLVKTFMGMSHARQVANTLADALEV